VVELLNPGAWLKEFCSSLLESRKMEKALPSMPDVNFANVLSFKSTYTSFLVDWIEVRY